MKAAFKKAGKEFKQGLERNAQEEIKSIKIRNNTLNKSIDTVGNGGMSARSNRRSVHSGFGGKSQHSGYGETN